MTFEDSQLPNSSHKLYKVKLNTVLSGATTLWNTLQSAIPYAGAALRYGVPSQGGHFYRAKIDFIGI